METTDQVKPCYCRQETIGGVLCDVISAGYKIHGVKSAYGERSAQEEQKPATRSRRKSAQNK